VRAVYVDSGGRFGSVDESRLDGTTERHLVALPPPPLTDGDPIAALEREPAAGLVVVMTGGSPNRVELRRLRRGLELKRHVWLHWPEEGAVELATRERLESYRRHWLVINFYQVVIERLLYMIRVPMRIVSTTGADREGFTVSGSFTVTFSGAQPSEALLVYAIGGLVHGVLEQLTTIDVTHVTFRVTHQAVTPSGVDITFNRPVDTSLLHLYNGQFSTYGPADVTLVGASTGPVRGSLSS